MPIDDIDMRDVIHQAWITPDRSGRRLSVDEFRTTRPERIFRTTPAPNPNTTAGAASGTSQTSAPPTSRTIPRISDTPPDLGRWITPAELEQMFPPPRANDMHDERSMTATEMNLLMQQSMARLERTGRVPVPPRDPWVAHIPPVWLDEVRMHDYQVLARERLRGLSRWAIDPLYPKLLDEGTTMDTDNTINPMFIGMQYHRHQSFKEKLSRDFRAANMGNLENLMASCGLAYYCYEDDKAKDDMLHRAIEHHADWEQAERERASRVRRFRETLKAHMALATKTQQKHSEWRDFAKWQIVRRYSAGHASSVLHTLNTERSTHAATIASAMHDGEDWGTDGLIDALLWVRSNVNRAKSDEIFDKLEAQSNSTADIAKCADCGTFVSVDGASENSDGNRICDDCRGNYCESSVDGLIHADSAYQVYSSVRSYRNDSMAGWCLRHTGMDNYYWYESGRCFFTDEEDRDSLEEDEDSDDGLNGYHSTGRSVFFVEQAVDKTRPCLGVELEVYCNDSRWQTVKNLRKVYKKEQLIMERDGSLDEDQGFEIVTRPLGRTEWSDFGPELLKRLRANDVVGFNAPTETGTYGIHVNLHRRWLSPLAEARIMMFLCANENKSFVRAIAQRDEIYDPSINIGQLMKYEQTVQRIGGKESRSFVSTNGRNKYAPKIYGVGKYAPVNWKDSIAEFRIFQSTLNTGSFMKNLEFIWALVEWTKPAAATGTTWMYQDFVKWLNTPANRKEYPYLIKYLSKKSFPLGGDNEADDVESEWADLMVKPDTEAHLEGTDA